MSKELFVRKDKRGQPLVRVCVALENGQFYYELCRDVAAGEFLFPDTAAVSVHYQAEQETLGKVEKKGLPLQIDWILTWKLLTEGTVEGAKDLCERLPKPGRRSAAHESLLLFSRKHPLPDDDRAWVGHILRATKGACGIEEALRVRGMVSKNAERVCGAVSEVGYGWALFPALAYAEHSCAPAAYVVHRAVDEAAVYAARSLRAGERVTVRKSYPPFAPWYRCMQTAPSLYRHAFVRVQGKFCACGECSETTKWLKTCAGASPGEGLDAETVQRVTDVIDECWREGEEAQAERYFGDLTFAATCPVQFIDKAGGAPDEALRMIAGTADAATRFAGDGLLRKLSEQGADVERTASALLDYFAKVAFYEFFATTSHHWTVAVKETGKPPEANDRLVRLLNGFCTRVLVHRLGISINEATSQKHDMHMFQSVLLSETMAFPQLQQMLPGLVAGQ